MKVAAVILAAGASSRMGEPKQLMSLNGITLIKQAVNSALLAECRPVYVVLGAENKRIAQELTDLPVCLVENAGWRAGMGGSIRCGLEAVLGGWEQADSLLLMLADQPLVGPSELRKLIEAARSGEHQIVASEYAGTVGVPALFLQIMFPTLQSLLSSEGARGVIHDPRFSVFAVPMPEAEFDIDTPEDYRRALNTVDQKTEATANGF